MSNCYKTVANILRNTQIINEFLIDAEKYYAHISINKNDDPEILETHTRLVQTKLSLLTIEHNLDPVIDSLINDIIIQNNIYESQSCGDYLKKLFVDTITHRLERYGGNADRFFYLPDKRPFFAVQEFSGILDNDDDLFGKGHFDAYVKEGEKLQSIRKE